MNTHEETIGILNKWLDLKIDAIVDEHNTPWIAENQVLLSHYLQLRILERLASIDDTLITIMDNQSSGGR